MKKIGDTEFLSEDEFFKAITGHLKSPSLSLDQCLDRVLFLLNQLHFNGAFAKKSNYKIYMDITDTMDAIRCAKWKIIERETEGELE